jgi:hypothetical protein
MKTLIISTFHSVPGVPHAKMERFAGVQPVLARVCPPLFAGVVFSKLIPVNHLHKPLPELFTYRYAFIGDINVVILNFA